MNSMAVTLCSGSSGNSTLVSNGTSHVLVDCGMSLRRLTKAMAGLGLTPRELSGVLLTHEHTDHTSALRMLGGLDIPVFSTEGTLREAAARHGLSRELLHPITDGIFEIDGIEVTAFQTSHDAADSRGYTFGMSGAKVGVCTDLGEMTDTVLEALTGCDYVVLECNHDVNMLKNGPYPLYLRRRILSRYGHLSNEDCAEAAALLAEAGTKRVTLAHMSEENNDPSLAMGAVIWALARRGLAECTAVDVAPRYEAGEPFAKEGYICRNVHAAALR